MEFNKDLLIRYYQLRTDNGYILESNIGRTIFDIVKMAFYDHSIRVYYTPSEFMVDMYDRKLIREFIIEQRKNKWKLIETF